MVFSLFLRVPSGSCEEEKKHRDDPERGLVGIAAVTVRRQYWLVVPGGTVLVLYTYVYIRIQLQHCTVTTVAAKLRNQYLISFRRIHCV
jgi:hypothetical protein